MFSNKKFFAAGLLALFLLFNGALPALAADNFFTWDVSAASRLVEEKEKKPCTLMIYMNGSDLESEDGAATEDLMEILDSGLDGGAAHLVLFTGGACRWQNDVVPDSECVLWEAEDGWLYEMAGAGPVNMGSSGTLSGFIQYGMQNYPADKYGLILWDHGGGAIAGYGQDENFIEGNLTLADMQLAFEKAGLRERKLEFIGFDSCLMASVEMAVVAADYARYLIASEDLEPSQGWNYNFLRALNGRPAMDGKRLGIQIVDAFMDFYGPDTDEILNLSVIDLSQSRPVMEAMGRLMAPCSDSLTRGQERAASFRTLANKRNRTKTFGEGSPRDNECDMVDIGDMAVKLRDLYPAEAEEVLRALEGSVVYNRHNSNTDLKGLSAYYIYGGKEVGGPALDTYASLALNDTYTQYLRRFYRALTNRAARGSRSGRTAAASEPPEEIILRETVLWRPAAGRQNRFRMAGLTSEAIGRVDAAAALWPQINGRDACLFPVNHSAQNTKCAIPAEVNGRNGDLMVVFNEKYPQGLIEGVRNSEGIIIQKGYDALKKGDRIALYYLEMDGPGGETEWVKSSPFVIKEIPEFLTWAEAGKDGLLGERVTDVKNDVFYTVQIK